MAKNEGKKFEEDFQKSVPKEWFFYRLKDSSGSWSNDDTKSRFTPKNMCDFFMYNGEFLYGIECKSFKGKSMPYSNIANHQLDGLFDMSIEFPVFAQGFFLLNFRDLAETYMINAHTVKALKVMTSRKSISLEEARRNGTLIPQQLKRVRYRYDLSVLIKQ